MINSSTLSHFDVDYLLSLKEVIAAKEKIDLKSEGTIYFNIDLTSSLRKMIYEKFGLELSQINTIPMRWIKGDTKPHIDRGNLQSFDKTYLAYLTDSTGELIIDGNSYPISKGNAFVFSEGLQHETIGTGLEPRLLLGPMSEQGISVGSSFNYPGGTTVYIRQISGILQYSIDQTIWSPVGNNFPISVTNSNPSLGIVTIEFITDITLDNSSPGGINKYFICGSDNIQFGSTSLNTDGSRTTITIDGVTDYPGLIQNGYISNSGYNNISVYNLIVDGTSSTLVSESGWIGQTYYGQNSINNYIINCSSLGDISVGGGGIVGSSAAAPISRLTTLFIIGCSSSGSIGGSGGGIVGIFSANGNNGYTSTITCQQCWSTGIIGYNSGGIFAANSGNTTYTITNVGAYANKCYSSGSIGNNGGGIFGYTAGYFGYAAANSCYSTGSIGTDAGGIFGSDSGSGGATYTINCYSAGTITTSGNGIYGSNRVNNTAQNCYAAGGTWNDMIAIGSLTGTPNPVVGTTWIYSGASQPYELANMGYTPYTSTNISIQPSPSLIQTFSEAINSGNSTSNAIVNGKSYQILQKSGGNSSSYGTITIDSNTGAISTTSSTNPGTYTLYIRNTGSYNITTFNLTINAIPNPAICFPAGTPVLTDQGEIAINKIDTKIHTIRGQQIVAITESIPLDTYLICIERNSLGNNVPNRKTIISKDHKLMCDNKLVRAEYLIRYNIPGIYKIQYKKEILYNVLLKEHSLMSVNNLIVETLNPENILAKIYSGNYTPEQKNMLINKLNKYNIKQRSKSFIGKNILRA